jgi:hypothetical protein
MKIELNEEEAKVLVNLLDVAVKSVGIQAAESAMHFVRKIDAAIKEAGASTPAEDPAE